jgi:peptidyl-prolyl cis-trans isomerase B (cyclophilin B)
MKQFIVVAFVSLLLCAGCFVSLLLCSGCKEKPLDLSKPVYVTVRTTMGDVTVLLYEDTPLHRDNFIRLCLANEYEGMIFHRVIKDFVVQGGDPSSKEKIPGKLYGDGDGGYTVPAEIRPHYFNKRGALIDAKEIDSENPERASAGTQFCFVQGKVLTDEELDQRESRINDINRNWLYYTFLKQTQQPDTASLLLADALADEGPITIPADRREVYKTIGGVPHLDGSVTIFGEVTEGFDIVEKMSLVETDQNDRPTKDIIIISTKVFN